MSKRTGFTLIELLIVAAISAIVLSGIGMFISQLLTNNTRSTNHMTAVRQVQNAGYWINQDALKMQKTGTLPAPVKAVIAIPTQIVDGLIQALQAQRDKQTGGGKPSTGTTVQ
jgi:prepilin-type N-terminal cleavage/methylation domain-containing protein